MGYENGYNLGLITESPVSGEDRIVGGDEAGQWEGKNGFDVEKWWGYVESIFKWGGSLDDPIHWNQEKPGMQAVSNDQFTVVASTQLTRKPKGSRVNVAEGLISPGDVVIEWARGTAANTKNSYVYVTNGETKGKQGWIKTIFLGHIPGTPMSLPEKDIETQTAPAKKLPVLPIAAIGYFLLR